MEIRTTTSDLRMALQEAERRSAEQDKQSRFLATLQWLGAVDQSAKHKLLLQKREAGTADWFLQAAEYKSWKTPAGSALWLHGIPGCGKSVIAAVITEDLLNTNAKEERVATAYFHFDFSNKNDSTLGMLLRSVITQLSLQASLVPPCLGRFANDRLKGTKLNGIESTYKDIVAQPDNIDLATLLVEVVDAHFDSVYLVIDAMDEASDLEDLLRYLTDLLSQRSNKLHVLLTSRKETTIVSALENVVDTSVEMDPVATNADIGTYVMNEVARQPKLRKWSEGLRQEVQTALTKDACGMYVDIWSSFQCSHN
ncbi:hypothetical protein KVT40_008494 [Elsinoe batatas]|uniref:Nephrocystin 3-like N-terminal domain-containing protein n=1 Tax=Elsinoe batatas TaxID=2601811 RepID=A0A8K0PDW2_9PEZI|nr:hypothetical protein KVT40_008494 [Elsinoe batatas]